MRRRALRADPPKATPAHVPEHRRRLSVTAVHFRSAGGYVSSLLSLAGWSSLEMAARFVAAAESDIAVTQALKLDLGLSFD